MWVFTKNGFFSAVQNFKNPDLIHVRARFKGDLERLCEEYGVAPEVVSTPGNDYPFRMDFTREKWAEIMSEEARRIDYPNFKNAVHFAEGASLCRNNAYLSVWEVLKYHTNGSRK